MLQSEINILTCKSMDVELRQIQVDFLTWVQENINNFDVFVGNLPTGSGKSICATSIADWIVKSGFGTTSVVAPQIVHQNQYTTDFPWISSLKGMRRYPCVCLQKGSCGDQKTKIGKLCTDEMTNGSGCTYMNARTACEAADTAIFNMHSYFFFKHRKKFLIVDEGHNLTDFLIDMFSTQIWHPEVPYDENGPLTPAYVQSILKSQITFLSDHLAVARDRNQSKQIEELEAEIEKISSISNNLILFGKDVLILHKRGKYMGKFREDMYGRECSYIYIKPLNVDKLGDIFLWPDKIVDKIFIMSATFGETDVEMLGLNKKRVGYFVSDSPIPTQQRPFIDCNIADMSAKTRLESYPKVLRGILSLANSKRHLGEKGLVHCTYEFSKWMQSQTGVSSRFMFHNQKNRMEMFEKFRSAPEPVIFIACGMEEGIDLPYDMARWQIITQLMFPYLGDDVNKHNMSSRTDRYNWPTVRCVIQQTGRVCRGPKDYGITYMFDSRFENFKNRTKKMWYKWFTDSIKKLSEL